MKTKVFRGKDKADIDAQVWAWKVNNPKIIMVDTYPIERLPLQISPMQPASDQVSMRVDFEDKLRSWLSPTLPRAGDRRHDRLPFPAALVDRRSTSPATSTGGFTRLTIGGQYGGEVYRCLDD
jgi:hypothetical protein